jgi:hypothetical protein
MGPACTTNCAGYNPDGNNALEAPVFNQRIACVPDSGCTTKVEVFSPDALAWLAFDPQNPAGAIPRCMNNPKCSAMMLNVPADVTLPITVTEFDFSDAGQIIVTTDPAITASSIKELVKREVVAMRNTDLAVANAKVAKEAAAQGLKRGCQGVDPIVAECAALGRCIRILV